MAQKAERLLAASGYELQALGGLARETARVLDRLAAGKNADASGAAARPRVPRPEPGTMLVHEHAGLCTGSA